MPRIAAKDVKPSQVYGQEEVDLTITMRERLMARFAAHELVEVRNIDDETMEWQFLPDHAETSSLTDDGIKITYRDEPELWSLDAGDTDYLTGSCAYIMIESLVKKLIIKRVGIVERPQSAKEIRNFNFKDPIRVEAFIDQIYVGKVTPSFNQVQPNKVAPIKKPVTARK